MTPYNEPSTTIDYQGTYYPWNFWWEVLPKEDCKYEKAIKIVKILIETHKLKLEPSKVINLIEKIAKVL